MSKFNKSSTQSSRRSPVVSETAPSTTTYEGAPGYARDAKSELFLLAIANMVGEDTFYEGSSERDTRFRTLVHRVAVEDPHWMSRFLPWLRNEANMRSASIVGALEASKALLHAEVHGYARPLVASVIQRADEPGEALAYWMSAYGRAIPKPVKRGIGDAIIRLGTEFNYVKWDSEGRGFRFVDILNLVHPGDRRGSAQHLKGAWQRDLFSYAVKSAYNDDVLIPETLGMLTRRQAVLSMPVDERRQVLQSPEVLREAGMTWEALAGWLQGEMDASAWGAIIPSMAYTALLRNLRNFDKVGISDDLARQVAEKLADPNQVSRSRQFPFRFLSAYRAAPSLRWSWPLEQALNHSLVNVPELPGRTLVLVDRSPSMWGQRMSKRSQMLWADGAAVFGAAVALRAEQADLVQFGVHNESVPFSKGESVLKLVEKLHQFGGTDIPSAVMAHFKADVHDRVVIVTDEQTRPGWLPSNGHDFGGSKPRLIDDLIPKNVPVYMWNFGGYTSGAMPSGHGNRHTFGGLSDAAFRMIPLLESTGRTTWPF